MIVFLAGMQRSGSTFSFNVVREVLERRGNVYQEPINSAIEAINHSGEVDHVLLKSHSADDFTIKMVKLGSIKCVCTVRSPEDAIASWMETFSFHLDDSISQMLSWLKMFEQLRPYCLIVRYEQVDRRPWLAAWRIARHINPNVTPIEVAAIARIYSKEKIKEISDKLSKDEENVNDLGFSYYNQSTFFHRRHVSSIQSRPAVDRIGADAVRQIRVALREYVDADGVLR